MTTNRERLGFDPRSLLGKNVNDAIADAFTHGVMLVVVRQDGAILPKTEDRLPEKRVEIEVSNGVVVGFAYDGTKFRPE